MGTDTAAPLSCDIARGSTRNQQLHNHGQSSHYGCALEIPPASNMGVCPSFNLPSPCGSLPGEGGWHRAGDQHHPHPDFLVAWHSLCSLHLPHCKESYLIFQ